MSTYIIRVNVKGDPSFIAWKKSPALSLILDDRSPDLNIIAWLTLILPHAWLVWKRLYRLKIEDIISHLILHGI